MQVIDYTLLTSKSPRDLARGVREHLLDGWQPYGGIAIDTDAAGDLQVAQALVRYEKHATVD